MSRNTAIQTPARPPRPARTAARALGHGAMKNGALEGEVSRPVTLQQIADHLGVGLATASRALSGSGSVAPRTRAEIIRTAQEMGFDPNPTAQRLAKGRCDATIGIFSMILDLGVGTRKLQIIQQRLGERGFDMPVYAYRGTAMEPRYQATMLRMLCRQNYRALICGSSWFMNEDAVREVKRYLEGGGLMVAYSYSYELPFACDQVIFDLEDSLYQSARHLLELGHRRLGYFFGGSRGKHRTPRDEGFERALGEYGAQRREEWVFVGAGHTQHELDGELAAQQFLALPEGNRPTAICIVNDTAAAAFVAVVQDAGVRIPEDLSVVGHDDRAIARFCRPALTTVSHPVEAIAERVVEMLCERLDGIYDGLPRIERICGDLIVRSSTGPPP